MSPTLPRGIVAYTGSQFPSNLFGNLFVAFWNGTTDSQRIVRIDEPPEYDAPPSSERLLQDAARNHQMEAAYRAQGTAMRATRDETSRTWRDAVAVAEMVLASVQQHQWDGADSRRVGHLASPMLPLPMVAAMDDWATDDTVILRRKAG